MPSKNQVSLIGRVGGMVEYTSLTNGTKVGNFSLATNERYKDKETGEWKDSETDWHRIVVWGPVAEAHAKNINKGDLVGVEGRLKVRSYRKEGVLHSSVQIVADEVLYLKKYVPSEASRTLSSAAAEVEDDLPF
jgi:single-strand DNA-binding protein